MLLPAIEDLLLSLFQCEKELASVSLNINQKHNQS